MPERRFSDDEAAEIFKHAAEQQQSAFRSASRQGEALVPHSEGMSLAQLQDIGREVGISAELVASAARSLDRGGTGWVRRFVGLPLGVGHTVRLDRKLSEAEWERLVVDLRETFDARGRLREEGAFRQWTNGNLQALLEPTPDGQQLRLRTRNGNALAWMMAGLGTVGAGVVTSMIAAISSGVDPTAAGPIYAVGAGLFALGAARLPSWARTRSRQMKEIAERVATATDSPPDAGG